MALATQLDPNEPFLTDARERMVDSQIRPNKVTDPRILDAMRRLPREQFLPDASRALAYSDQNVPLGHGRVLLQPMVLARLVQAAEPLANETVLVVGSGTGYSAALLAMLGCAVTALEDSDDLSRKARPVLAAIARTVAPIQGPLPAGWPGGAPYDLILIDGAVPAVPPILAGQLKRESGRLVTILSDGGRTGRAVHAEPTQAGVSVRALFDCLCPILPGFVPAPAFEF